MIRLAQKRRERSESIVPMINVAFLLLIFFLMVAVIVPPDPIRVNLPQVETQFTSEADEAVVLFVSSDGKLTLNDGSEPVLAGLSGQYVTLRADAQMSAGTLAAVLSDLSATFPKKIELAVSPRQ